MGIQLDMLDGNTRIFQPRPWVRIFLIIVLVIIGAGIVVTIAFPIGTFERRFYFMLPLFTVQFLGIGSVLWLQIKGDDWLMLSSDGLQKGKVSPIVKWEDVIEIKVTTLRDITPGGFLLQGNAPRTSVDIRDDATCLKDFDFANRLSAKMHKSKGYGELAINPIPYRESTREVLDALIEFYLEAVPTAKRDGDRCGTELSDA